MSAPAAVPPVVVVGAGLAGLACATTLHAAGVDTTVLEASDGVGGRVRTDAVDGFLLDRGFQVVLTAYPELHRQLDVAALDLRTFRPGAAVWRDGRASVVADPFRDPAHLVQTALAPVGSPLDKARIAKLRHDLQRVHPVDLLRGPDVATAESLRTRGFSDTMVRRFFRPLVGGIQLDPELRSSRRMFDIVFRMLADGDSAVPAAGMGAIPAQLAARLPAGSIRLGERVQSVAPDGVVSTGAGRVAASAVVVATEGPAASHLLGLPLVASRPVSCVYFAARMPPPVDGRYVVLDGTGDGPVLNVAVMSAVAPEYAPPGHHLVAAALPGVVGDDVAELARAQLRRWWGAMVDGWEHLRTYRIPHGQPDQSPPFRPVRRVALGDGLFVCGDHRDTASIQGALHSGRRCADDVLQHLGVTPPEVTP
ncbi:MAG: FAD-dependent oxidoreductase [Ilumatobacteraceae bacterium]|nr:FAD-dependent oxidoreductase [Ilumatobacteraceae bacterium]